MVDETAFLDLTDCLETISHYKAYIADAKSSIEKNNLAIADFDELIELKKQAKTSIASRYAEKLVELLNDIPNDIKLSLSKNSLYGTASTANLTLDFLGKRFFLLNKGIDISSNEEEQTTATVANHMAKCLDKLVFSKDMLDILEIYNEYKRNENNVVEILIERELEKKSKALALEVSGLTHSISACENEIREISRELEIMKKSGIIEKLFNLKYTRHGKLQLSRMKDRLITLNAKLAKAQKDEEYFKSHADKEKEKIAKNVKSSIKSLVKFVEISNGITDIRLEHDRLYNAPIADLEERKAVLVQYNDDFKASIHNWEELIEKNEKEAKVALKHVYEDEELSKKLLATSTEWGNDERTTRAIEYVKANYKKALSSKITSLLN